MQIALDVVWIALFTQTDTHVPLFDCYPFFFSALCHISPLSRLARHVCAFLHLSEAALRAPFKIKQNEKLCKFPIVSIRLWAMYNDLNGAHEQDYIQEQKRKYLDSRYIDTPRMNNIIGRRGPSTRSSNQKVEWNRNNLATSSDASIFLSRHFILPQISQRHPIARIFFFFSFLMGEINYVFSATLKVWPSQMNLH